jgi:MFS family permease
MTTPSNMPAPYRLFDDLPMTRRQILAIMLTIGIAVLDGYDVGSMSFVAPVLSKAWGIDRAALGILLASGLVGMAVGSLGLAPFADKFGRKPVTLWALAVVTVGSLACGLAESMTQLVLARAFTGIGMGSLVASLATLNAEFANARNRSFAVASTAIGLPLGGAIGGLVASVVLKSADWHWVFLIGAIAGAVMTLLAVVLLPESPTFLITQRPKNALQRLNRVLGQLGHQPVAELPPAHKPEAVSYRALFSPAKAPDSIRFIVCMVLVVIGGHYIINWLPQIVTTLGFAASTGSLVASIASLAGVAAPLIFGALTRRFDTLKMAAFVMCGFGAALIGIGFVPPILWMFVLIACSASFFLSASAAMLQASMVQTFAPNMRTTAIGFVMGLGRVAAGLGPFLAGQMFAAGMTRGGVSLSFAVLAIIAGLLVSIRRRQPTLAAA